MRHSIIDLLIKNGYPVRDYGPFCKAPAKYRGGDNPNSLSINKTTGWFTDFKTGETGPPEKLAKLIGDKLSQQDFVEELPPKKLKTRIYPESILKNLLPQYDLFLDRGISLETLRTYKAGLAHANKLAKRVCFPIYDELNRIVGFAGRWFHPNVLGDTPKWKFIGRTNTWIFPCHLNENTTNDTIILVESIGDLLMFHEAGIKNVFVLFGCKLSTKLLMYVCRRCPARVVIATNNDAVGKAKALKIAQKCRKMFSSTEILVRHPVAKDFGDMNPASVNSWYEAIHHAGS